MSAKREIANKSIVDATRNILLSRVPEVTHILYALIEQKPGTSDNASDPFAQRISIARQKVQLGAIRDWLDRAGVIPPKAQAERPADLQLADMTVTELRRLAETLDGEIAERAKVVPAPELAPPDSQGIDSLM